jgi:hypothetical protein
MSKKPKIQVIKVENHKTAFRPKRFPPQPRMYLELIENKDKIKQDLINKEYIPKNTLQPQVKTDVENEVEDFHDDSDNQQQSDKEVNYSDSDSENEMQKSRSKSIDKEENSDSENYSDSDSDYKPKKGYKLSKSRSRSRSSSSDDSSSDDDDDDDDGGLNKRIKQLLQKDKSSSNRSTPDRYSIGKNNRDEKLYEPAPSLSELEKQGIYQQKKFMRDLNQTSIEEQNEEDLKRELLYKFEILKKSYSNVNLPEFTIHSDYTSMLKTYEMTVKKVTLDSNVDNYKTYLIYGFMGVEFVLGNWFKFDMQGFTQQQIVSMNSYEKLLIELGEKSYVPQASNWPVEVRLLFAILLNAGFFIVTKMIMKKTGSNLLSMINNMNSNNTNPSSTPDMNAAKRKMKGPNINLGDIPDI